MFCKINKKCKSCQKTWYDSEKLKFIGIQEPNKLLMFNCTCDNTIGIPEGSVRFTDEYFSFTEAAKSLGITRQGLSDLIRRQKIITVKVSGKKKIHYKNFAEFLATRKGIKDKRCKIMVG